MVISVGAIARAAADGPIEVKIEAEGSVDYDLSTNLTTASKNVVLSKGDLTIECQNLIYDGETGVVRAFGDVKISTGDYSYQTQSLYYDLNRQTGNLAEFKGRLKGDSRDYYFFGRESALSLEEGVISKAAMTRCPKPNPDYLLTTKQIDYDSERVYLRNVVLKVKGIPVFYFPRLSFKRDDADLPDIRLDYNHDDGLKVEIDAPGPVKNNWSRHYRVKVSTRGTNELGYGLKYRLTDQISNTAYLYYNFDGYWRLEDYLGYQARRFDLSIGGYKEFSDTEKTELGISLTGKHWGTPVGSWRAQLLARDVSALNSLKQEYGGIYWGYRLDYKPFSWLDLSYLRLNSEAENEAFGDFFEDYKLGDNYFYNVKIPLTPVYSFVADGTYNADNDVNWIRRFYGINYETCCFRITMGWDDLERSWEFATRIKF